MKNLKFTKDFVLSALQANRNKHALIYEEDIADYRKQAKKLLESTLKKVEQGQAFKLWFYLEEPMQHMKEYDRAISMLQNSVGIEVELTDLEYAQFIQDDWQWRQDFLTVNSTYSKMAAETLNE